MHVVLILAQQATGTYSIDTCPLSHCCSNEYWWSKGVLLKLFVEQFEEHLFRRTPFGGCF